MMILSIILLTISFLLQGIMSNFIGCTLNNVSVLFTIYPLIALLMIYPNFENKNKFILLLVIFGLLTDLVYSNTFIFNTCLFYLIYKINKIFHFFFPYILLTINISNLIGIYVYHLITFLFLIILNFDNYNILILFKIILNSTIMTIIYTSIIYWLLNILKRLFDLKEVK